LFSLFFIFKIIDLVDILQITIWDAFQSPQLMIFNLFDQIK